MRCRAKEWNDEQSERKRQAKRIWRNKEKAQQQRARRNERMSLGKSYTRYATIIPMWLDSHECFFVLSALSIPTSIQHPTELDALKNDEIMREREKTICVHIKVSLLNKVSPFYSPRRGVIIAHSVTLQWNRTYTV